jgi:hypothetical protein
MYGVGLPKVTASERAERAWDYSYKYGGGVRGWNDMPAVLLTFQPVHIYSWVEVLHLLHMDAPIGLDLHDQSNMLCYVSGG